MKYFIYCVSGSLLISIILYFVPVKFTTTISNFKNKNNKNTVIICESTQTTGGDWRIKNVLGEEQNMVDIGEDIIIQGKKPKMDSRKSGGIAIDAEYIFSGQFIKTANQAGEKIIPVFTSIEWDILSPMHSRNLVTTPYNYLNIYNYFSIY